MVVDAERVLLRLKAHIASKRSHGSDELLVKIAELEVESEIPESEEAYDARPPRRVGASDQPARELPADGRKPAMASH